MKKLDEEFDTLMDEIKLDYEALAGGGNVTENGKLLSHTQTAISIAKNASRLAEVLYQIEEIENEEMGY